MLFQITLYIMMAVE